MIETKANSEGTKEILINFLFSGYGSVSPKSLPGRILTVFYAAIGIPLTLCYLATVGDFLSRCIRSIYYKLRV